MEWIGLILVVLSLVFTMIHERVDAGPLNEIMFQHQMVFWLGLLIWALGYLKAGKK